VTTLDVTTETPVRCAPWTREQGADPVGSVGTYRSFLMVEWPLPWPKDIGEVPALAALRAELAAAGCRLQGLVPKGDSSTRTLIHYGAQLDSDGAFSGYRRSSLTVEPAEVIGAARHLLAATDPAPPTSGHEVLVCTHGRRDRCCGSLGTDLALQLLADPDALGADTATWRTSHTGGHRFAPTALVFPEGTGWAFADIALLARVVAREGPVTDVLDRYRGCAGLASPRVQALERAVLAEVGWGLFDMARWGSDDPDGATRLHVKRPDGPVTWEATVNAGRVLPVPECGAPVTEARKTSTELVVGALRRVS